MSVNRRANVVLLGIDSLRADHMSLYGYCRLTTPHIDRFAGEGAVFMKHFSPSIPTTPGYSTMLTGMDCFGTDVVALRHKGPLGTHVQTLPEILREHGYNTSCVGFTGNPASRGFDTYLDYKAWQPDSTGRCPKAQNLNDCAIPELRRLAGEEEPFFLFLRHMDPHSPYLPPRPFERLFYGGDERREGDGSLQPVWDFKPFADFFRSWIPEGCTDRHYVDAQYDGALAYMDAAIGGLFAELAALGLEEETLVVVTSDHGETLYEHECYYDHHGLYDCTLTVPLVLRWPGKIAPGARHDGFTQIKDITPTILDLLGIAAAHPFDGHSLAPFARSGGATSDLQEEREFYITECTWMRKHGWRTPEWKLIRALEPDFHFKPDVELYHLVDDPLELHNLAGERPDVVQDLTRRLEEHSAGRERETGRVNPMLTNLDWHGHGGGPFTSSRQAYETLHIGSIRGARALQEDDGKQDDGKHDDKQDDKRVDDDKHGKALPQ